MTSIKVENRLGKFFKWLGSQTAHRPLVFIFVPIVLGFIIILLAGAKIISEKKLERITNLRYLYYPYQRESYKNKMFVEALFPMNTSNNFEYRDLTDIGYMGVAIIRAKDEGTILRTQIFDDISKLNKSIHQIYINWGDKKWYFKDICAKQNGECSILYPSFIQERIRSIENQEYHLPYPYYFDIRNMRIEFFGLNLGGVKLHENDTVKFAKAISLMYNLDSMTPEQTERAALWEKAFIKSMKEIALNYSEINFFCGHSAEQELEINILSQIPYIFPTAIIMIIFCMWTMSLDNSIMNKPWVGLAGCFCAIYAVAVGFSIGIIAGVKFVDINMFISLLILGIGMDDSFMLIASWKKTDSKLELEERLCRAYSHVGVSITITSLTNLVSFIIGSLSSLPAIHNFCIYMSVTLVISYIFQITTFGGILLLFGSLEQRNKHSFFIWKTVSESSESKATGFLHNYLFVKNTKNENRATLEEKINRFFKGTFAESLQSLPARILVVVTYALYLGMSIYGATLVKEDLDLKDLVRLDSYLFDFFKVREECYQNYQIRFQVVINRTLDYSNENNQKVIEDIISNFESMPNMADNSTTWSWLKVYKLISADKRTQSVFHGLNLTKKEDFITGLRHILFKLPIGRLFENDVIFNENYTEIVASRFFLIVKKLENSFEEKNLFEKILDIKKTLPGDIAVYNYMFPKYELFSIIKSSVYKSLALTAAILLVVVAIFMPNLICTFWVAISVVSVEVGVIGLMGITGIKLDPMAMMSLIMCLGLSVDYTAHISYAYYSSKETTPELKVADALGLAGYPIIQSCSSTCLALVVVFFLPSNTFLSPTINFMVLLNLAVLHSLVLLPTALPIASKCFRKKAVKETYNNNLNSQNGVINMVFSQKEENISSRVSSA